MRAASHPRHRRYLCIMSVILASTMNFIREACEHVFGVREVMARAEEVSQLAVRALTSERVPTLTTGSCGSACLKWTHFEREREREIKRERQRESSFYTCFQINKPFEALSVSFINKVHVVSASKESPNDLQLLLDACEQLAESAKPGQGNL